MSWHDANDSNSRERAAAASADASHEDNAAESGLFGADADEFAFLRDEEALPFNETKFKDALLFLVDCSALLQFPASEEDMAELDDEGRVKIKAEQSGSSIESGSGGAHGSAEHSSASPAARAASPSPAAAASSGDHKYPGQSQFQMVLRVILHSIKTKIINSPDDFVGVVFFGAREHINPNSFPHIYVHTPLQNLTAGAVRKLDRMLDPEQFDEEIGSLSEAEVASGKVEMDKILWTCSSLFQDAAVSNAHKRILLLTNNDTPYNLKDPMSRMRSVQKGKDLRDLDIQIQPIPVGKKPDASGRPKPFNPALFFKDIMIFDESESPESLRLTWNASFHELKESVFKKQMKKRALGSVPLQLGKGVSLGVKIYCPIRQTLKDSAVFLDKETNEKLETQTRYLDTNTGAVLRPHEIQKFYPYGGAKVVFTDDELKQIKFMGDSGLMLMGFKPLEALSHSHNYKNPYFLYPDDSQFTDSTKAFKALLLAMSELKQIAICRLIYRKGSLPRFVALIPQMAKIDPDGDVLQSPGMHLIFLPYADDLRKLRFEPTPIATPELIEDAKKVVAKLTSKSIPYMPNPVLQRHYRVIQAIALEETPPDETEFEDDCQPDLEGMAKYNNLISTFAKDTRELGEAAQAEAEPPPSRKRKAGEDGESKPKAPDVPYESIDWKQQLDNDTLKKLTVPVLKVFCRFHKLPLAGTKSVLLERITAALLSS